jgi:hypothetical protein
MKKFFLLLSIGSLHPTVLEIHTSPLIHKTAEGDIGSFNTKRLLAFIKASDRSVMRAIAWDGAEFPDNCNTRVSSDGKRYFFESIDPVTKNIEIGFSNDGQSDHTICRMPSESEIIKKINPSQFLWTTDPEGESIFMLRNLKDTDDIAVLQLEIWPPAGTKSKSARGYIPKLTTLIGSESFTRLMRNNSSRIMTREQYERYRELIRNPGKIVYLEQ